MTTSLNCACITNITVFTTDKAFYQHISITAFNAIVMTLTLALSKETESDSLNTEPKNGRKKTQTGIRSKYMTVAL